MQTSTFGWETVQFVVCVSQPDLISATDICKLNLKNHFLDLDVNVIVIIDIGLKVLVRQMIVCTELRWVVFGCCGVGL